MTLEQLKQALDDIGWDEHAAIEANEGRSPTDQVEIDTVQRLRQIGSQLTSAELDSLERHSGYASWVLRLSPFVAGDDPTLRARNYKNDANGDVRFWAARILDETGL